MSELGESTLQVSYKGAAITEQVLEKLIAAALREIKNIWPQAAERTKGISIAKDNTMSLGKEVHTAHIDLAAKNLRGDGLSFQVLKQPGKSQEHTLVFKGKDLPSIENALKALYGEPPMFDRLQPKEQNRGNPRLFNGKDLRDDIRIAREAINKRNAARVVMRPTPPRDKGHGR